jgi:hypothetical protein
MAENKKRGTTDLYTLTEAEKKRLLEEDRTRLNRERSERRTRRAETIMATTTSPPVIDLVNKADTDLIAAATTAESSASSIPIKDLMVASNKDSTKGTGNVNIVNIATRYTTNLQSYCDSLKTQASDPANNVAIQEIISKEINNYADINPISDPAKEFMAKSIWMWRQMKKDKKVSAELFTLVCVLDGFRSDPDTEDILQASREERILYSYFFYYKTLRVFNLDPAKNFIRRPLNEIDLGKKVIELEADGTAIGSNRIYNIMFQAFVFLVLLALLIPNWYNKIPPDLNNAITLYIGTKDKRWDANCLNFKINEIDNTTHQPYQQFEVFTPISSASPNLAVATRFKSDEGVIIAIKLGSGCSYVCIDDSPNESEVIVTQGIYKYINRTGPVDINGKICVIYNFEQLTSGNFEEVKDNINSNWASWKDQIIKHIRDDFSSDPSLFNQQQSMRWVNTVQSHNIVAAAAMNNAGGFKSKRRKHKSKRRISNNKRRRTNKRKHKSRKRRI